jgi:hypothetical protein
MKLNRRRLTGFWEVQVLGRYAEREASAESGILVYIARKEEPIFAS